MRKLWLLLGALVVLTISGIVNAQDDLIGPDTYPDEINPLTGLPAEDPEMLNRRPLLIKISNSPAIVRDYQIGLNDAEIVWEHLLSGGVTRFSAIFWEKDYEKIGPIRSARLVDFELTRMYRSLFTYSGMSQGTIEIFFRDTLMTERAVGGSGPCPPLCRYPEEGLALEHTLFANTAEVRDLAVEREANVTPDQVYGMAFSETAPDGGLPMDYARVRYRQTLVDWQWDVESGHWLRLQDGEPHLNMGEQVNATNVVIIEDAHTVQPFVSDQYWGPGNFAFSVNFIGSGRIYFLRDGMLYEGEWRRDTRENPLEFFDTDGNILPFKPGRTFFNLVPRWTDGYELELVSENPAQVTVTGSTGAAMRFGPSEAYVTPDVAYAGDTFSVIGRNHAGTWMQLKRNGERAIWLPVSRLDIGDVDIMSLPNPRPSHER